jgi:uncharacterized integral membrane protein (TIGR00698 family)
MPEYNCIFRDKGFLSSTAAFVCGKLKTKSMKIEAYIPGTVATLGIALLALTISTFHASFDSLVISIIIGLFLGNFIGRRQSLEEGINLSVRFFLRAGIALYGTQLILKGMHISVLLSTLLVFSSLFGLTLLASRILNIDRKTAILLASGLSICGASAIAVISPLIGAKREDTSISIIAVMMMGLTGIIFYPILYDLFSIETSEFIFFSGTTLPMLGQVKVAVGSICRECIPAAVEIKLIRISFLLFVVPALFFSERRENNSLVPGIPYFIIAFICFAVLTNTVKTLRPLLGYFESASSFLLSAGLAAIGLSVDFESIIEKGISPFAAILISWSVTLVFIYFVRNMF